MKRVIVTGASSFIGIHFIKEILEKEDIDVIAAVRPNSSKNGLLPASKKMAVLPAEAQEYSSLDRLIGKPCDVLLHLAWNGTRGADRMDEELQRRNYHYSVAAVEASIRLGCKTVITAGSQAEYGNLNCPVSEETICSPNTEYGKSKLRFFHTAQELSAVRGFHFKEPRFFSLYGPGDFENSMIISTLKKMLKNEPCDLTQGIQKWDFLYIRDAVQGILRLMENDCDDGAYNFGSGKSEDLKGYIEEMYKITHSNSELNYGAIPYPPTGMVSIQPIVEKLIRTGWHPKVTFPEGILHVIDSINGHIKS